MKFLKILTFALFAITINAHADENFLYGAFRKVYADNSDNAYFFLMLPSNVKIGTRFNYYDFKRNKITCCISTVEGPIDSNTLDKKFNIPTVWISDITVPGGGHDISGAYKPVVYLASIDKNISELDNVDIDFNGIIVDESAKLGKQKRTFTIGNRLYSVKRKEWPMAVDAGALNDYTITDISGMKPLDRPRKIVVHFGIN